jgi:hypothetical protein
MIMSDQRLATIIIKLLEKTRRGEINWEETNVNGSFQASFPAYSVIITSKGNRRTLFDVAASITGASQITVDYILAIFNQNGKLIDEVTDVDLNDILPESYEIMKELYEGARRVALKYDQALDDLLRALE